MSQDSVLTAAFGPILKQNGFKKKRGDTWYKDMPESIAIINLQKSDYSNKWYVNVAIWIKGLDVSSIVPLKKLDIEKPAENHCPFKIRWERIIERNFDEADVKNIVSLTDMDEKTIPDNERIDAIRRMIYKHILPFLEKSATINGLKKMAATEPWSCYMWGIAKDFLGSK